MNAKDWLRMASSKKLLAAYMLKRLAEEGSPMRIARIQNELSDPCGIVADILADMERVNILKFVSCDGQVKLIRPMNRLRKRGRKKS